jgi:hypothetical protein
MHTYAHLVCLFIMLYENNFVKIKQLDLFLLCPYSVTQ